MSFLPAYAELQCRSNFSFLQGASHPEELVARAQELGYSALALTDECSLAGVVRAHVEARRRGVHLIVGAQMQLTAPAAASEASDHEASAACPPVVARLVVLAQSRRGYGNLSQWITVARRRAPKGQYLAYFADVEGKTPRVPMLAGLPGCMALLVSAPQAPFETVFAQAMWLKTWLGPQRAFLSIALHHGPYDALHQHTVLRVAEATGLTVVATGDVLMHARSRKPLQDVLTATRLRCTVAECGWHLQPNAEAHLRSRARLAALYRPEWLEATVQIAGQCSFSMEELRYEYPQEIVPPGHTPTTWLRTLTQQGAATRFPQGVPDHVRQLIEHELALIAQLKYEPYFLTVADIVQWARSQGILCQGRGSAANSTVCYCLHITEVDPARMSVLFERFISAERNEPPDIDVDFEHQRREEVIQYLYRKYGRHRAALTGVVISYRPRSALRDVGRALDITPEHIQTVARAAHWHQGHWDVEPQWLAERGLDPQSSLHRLWMELTEVLIGFPRHLSQHPGGFVIARDDLAQLVPVENAAMEGRSVIQWDKDDLDTLGLIKVDILALGMLSAIRRALDWVTFKQRTQGRAEDGAAGQEKDVIASRAAAKQSMEGGLPRPFGARNDSAVCRARNDAALLPFRMQDIPAEDPAVYAMLSAGDSVGTFQVESRAQMSMLPRLKPRCFYDLVIEVAIVRPGPIQGGMVHPYLRRRNGEEPVTYPSQEVRQALQRTLGVPIFQEQVMQLAILAADFTPGEADQLRRAMAAWKRRGGLGPFHERLVGRMVAKGYERDYAEAIFRQIEGFGEYGFPESHAASFALLVYASAWLKRHHPDAFLAALLNSQPMGFYAPAQLVRDAQTHGVMVRPVDVLYSQWETTLETDDTDDTDDTVRAEGPSGLTAPTWMRPEQPEQPVQPVRPVRLGLSRILGFSQTAAQRLVEARHQAPFASVEDLARRASLDAHALRLLAEADALRALAPHRHQAAWAVAGVDTRVPRLLHASRTLEQEVHLRPPNDAAQTLADYRATGLTLHHHPLALLRSSLNTFKVQPAAQLRHCRPGQLARASGLVTHRQRPETAKGCVFVTLEDDTGTVNVIVWPAVAQAQRQPLLASTLLTVYGVWQSEGGEGGVCHLVARKLVDHTALLQGLSARSRDFR
ncbi:MAG: polymerase alpha subunit [Pseudomonadota bacterium]|jgi:error-prone DNA polymerase